jgi:ACS family D-galactonate transporter-like MFS transporter
MQSAEPLSQPLRPRSLQWLGLALLVLSIGINYADRGNLGVAASHIQRELHFSDKQLGILLGGFFWTYALFQLVAGKLIDRWNVNWVYAAGFLLWSATTGVTGLASSFATIMALRLLLGVGESIAYPAYSKIFVTTFPEDLRGAANCLIDAGSKMGPALGVMLGVKMMEWFSWRGMFVVMGAASLLWLLPWCFVASRLGGGHTHTVSRIAPGYSELLSRRAVWGTLLGLFGANYTWYFFITWLPYYFETEKHYARDRLAIMASLPFWAIAIGDIIFGLAADAIIRRGFHPGRVRQIFVSIGLLGCCGFMFAAVLVTSLTLSNVLLLLASVSFSAFCSNHWALTQTLAGARTAGKWTGLENFAGNLSGIVGPYLTGATLQATHSFFAAFAIACGLLLLSVAGFGLIVGKPVQVTWRSESVPIGNSQPLPQPQSK